MDKSKLENMSLADLDYLSKYAESIWNSLTEEAEESFIPTKKYETFNDYYNSDDYSNDYADYWFSIHWDSSEMLRTKIEEIFGKPPEPNDLKNIRKRYQNADFDDSPF